MKLINRIPKVNDIILRRSSYSGNKTIFKIKKILCKDMNDKRGIKYICKIKMLYATNIDKRDMTQTNMFHPDIEPFDYLMSEEEAFMEIL